MLNSRNAGLLGVAVCIIFWVAMLILGALRPSYSQLVNDISELGAIGTPNAIVWNIVGFIIPGLCLALVGERLALVIDRRRKRAASLARWLLFLFGLGIAGQGVFPAVMENGVPVITSWRTQAHLLVSVLSGLAWIAGLILLIAPMRRNPQWRNWYLVNVIAILVVIAGSFARGGRLPDGSIQRIVDAIVFAWFLLMSVRLIRIGSVKEAGTRAALEHA